MARITSDCWQGPLYFTVSIVLASLVISMSLHAPKDRAPSPKPNYQLLLNASRALRKSGFDIVATLLQISPEIFLSSPNSTIFAIKDTAIANASLPPWLLKNLLQYHTSPLKLSMNDLLNKSQGSCFPTLLHLKKVAITKIGAKERLVEINHVLVTHPDIFLEGPLSIHGVLQPFSSLDPHDVRQGWDYIQSPVCDSNSSLVSNFTEFKNMVEWTTIIRLLSSNGFVSFAIGLHSALHGIFEDYMNLNSTTIFAPPDFPFVASSSPLLDRIVRFHVLTQRFKYKELASLPDKTLLKTLVPNQYLEITGGANFTRGLGINRVELVAPDIFSSEKFVIHGISQAFRDGWAS
ncbi:fasciclin-like arabinogalactan protein 21 [Melia azedarach]|uniref:Fasciclin-like arabinogalactan protein 21 n=1 Tax=Melia azedarach TaxID=155640 RepID=A0ACC1Z2J5_MELAZ|nr:fasciclin-like arabinogalactan protein 21 [Melia azedarach]